MKYPVISVEELERLTAELIAGTSVDVHNSVTWIGNEPTIDLEPLTDAAEEIRTELAEHLAGGDADLQDLLEGRLAGRVHGALSGLPLEVLDDPGFWRYVAAAHMWDFIAWREAATFEKDWTKHRKYVDGTHPSECVPLRMFIRGRLSCAGDGDYALSSAVRRGTDLWRSHVLRIKVSYSPTLTQGLVRQVADHEIRTDELRSFAKRITRTGSNVLLPLYDEQAATELLDELRAVDAERAS